MTKNKIILLVLVGLLFSFQLFAADKAASKKDVAAKEQSTQAAPAAEESEPLDVHWKNFEINLNYMSQTGSSYSFGGGFSYSPLFKEVIKTSFYNFSLAPRAGFQFAKGSSNNIIPVFQFALGVPYYVTERFFVVPHLGFSAALESGSNSTFAMLGIDFGSKLESLGALENVVGLKWIDRWYFRYSALLADTTTHQVELGMGFDI